MQQSSLISAARRERRGNFVVWVLPMLGVSFAAASLVFDLGFLRTCRTNLQNAADAAAHAAAQQLDGTDAGMVNARRVAASLIRQNPTTASTYVEGIDPDTVIRLGQWHDNVFVEAATPSDVVAVQVDVERENIEASFSELAWGRGDMSAVAAATGLGGGPAGDGCALPIAIPDCALPHGAAVCNYDVVLNSDNNDSGAWAALGSGRPNASSVRNAIEGCVSANTTQVVSLNNGSINSASNSLAGAINSSHATWNAAEWGTQPGQQSRSGVNPYGHVLKGTIYVFDDPADCSGTKYNGTSLPLKGFASAVVYDVATSGKVSERMIRLRIVCELSDQAGGGGYYGTVVKPSLVR